MYSVYYAPGFPGFYLYIYIASSRPIQALTTRNLMYLMLEMGQHLGDRNMMNIQLYLQFWSSPGYQGEPTPRPPVRSCSIRPLFGLFEQPKRHILISCRNADIFWRLPRLPRLPRGIIVLHGGRTEVDPEICEPQPSEPKSYTKCDNIYIHIYIYI